MPTLQITICLDIDVNYYENKSGMTEQQIVDKVIEYVQDERNALAQQARVVAIKLLNRENIEED